MMKILIAYDGSGFANTILDDLRYAGLPGNAEVAVITLAEPEYFLVGKKTEEVIGWLSQRLIEARLSARLARDRIRADFPGWDVTFEARLALPPQEIIEKVRQWRPDLVIVGQHGRAGSKRAGLGHVAKRLFKEANCSVRIAREHTRPYNAPTRIIIPLAASQNPEAMARAIMSRLWPPISAQRSVKCNLPAKSSTRERKRLWRSTGRSSKSFNRQTCTSLPRSSLGSRQPVC